MDSDAFCGGNVAADGVYLSSHLCEFHYHKGDYYCCGKKSERYADCFAVILFGKPCGKAEKANAVCKVHEQAEIDAHRRNSDNKGRSFKIMHKNRVYKPKSNSRYDGNCYRA